MRSLFITLMLFFAIFAFNACSNKQSELYNKPAVFWYKQIIKDIKDKDLEQADAHYTSMSSEHVASPLLENTLLILALAHMEEEEYILANFYLDTYIKRYGDDAKSEYARYLKIKANFLSFTYPDRSQKLLLDTIVDIQQYINDYPNSIYTPLVSTILVKMQLGKYYLDKKIHKLYGRMNKPKAKEIYEQKLNNSALKDANMIDPQMPWYREFFE